MSRFVRVTVTNPQEIIVLLWFAKAFQERAWNPVHGAVRSFDCLDTELDEIYHQAAQFDYLEVSHEDCPGA